MPTGWIAAVCGPLTGSGATTCVRSRTRWRRRSSPPTAVGLEVDGERWRLAVDPGEPIWADGVVVTGAGPPIRVHGQPHQHPRVLDGRSYWLAGLALSGQMAMNACVIGSGETAAAVVSSLLGKAHKRSVVDVLTSRGVLYSRGRATRRIAGTPIRETGPRWPRRTGASSSRAPTGACSHSRPRRFSTRRAATVRSPGGRSGSTRVTSRSSSPSSMAASASASPMTWSSWRSAFTPAGSRRCSVAKRAAGSATPWPGPGSSSGSTLTCRWPGLSPPLHLPVLAGLAQGPGFPNLKLPWPAERPHLAPVCPVGAGRPHRPGKGNT